MADASLIKHIDENNFEELTAKGPTVVDFSAEWCGPCKMLTPVLEEVAAEMGDKVTITKLDIDNAQAIASKFQVTSVPTLILFKDGAEVRRLVGLRDAEAIKEFIES